VLLLNAAGLGCAGRWSALFPEQTPEHRFLRSLGEVMLGRPQGVPCIGTPFSIDYGQVNNSPASAVYKQATGQSPSELLQDPRYQGYFIKTKTPRTQILSFAPGVLDYLLGRTDTLPSRFPCKDSTHACLSSISKIPIYDGLLCPAGVSNHNAAVSDPIALDMNAGNSSPTVAPAPGAQRPCMAEPGPGETCFAPTKDYGNEAGSFE
jgi:hypothetical protein